MNMQVEPHVFDAYVEMSESIQKFISAVAGEEKYARDWVLAAGVSRIKGTRQAGTEIRVVPSLSTPAYAATGLLGWALDVYTGESNPDFGQEE